MREREPAMRALAKRVQNRSARESGVGVVQSELADTVEASGVRGPRNQPKRQTKSKAGKGKKKR